MLKESKTKHHLKFAPHDPAFYQCESKIRNRNKLVAVEEKSSQQITREKPLVFP